MKIVIIIPSLFNFFNSVIQSKESIRIQTIHLLNYYRMIQFTDYE